MQIDQLTAVAKHKSANQTVDPAEKKLDKSLESSLQKAVEELQKAVEEFQMVV